MIHPPIGQVRRVFLAGAFAATRFFFLVTVFFAVVLYLGISVGHTHPGHFVDVAAYLLPGNPVPVNVQCDITRVNPNAPFTYCRIGQTDDNATAFIYDLQARVISRVIRATQGITVGDLMKVWGAPDAYAAKGTGNAVGVYDLYWGSKVASVTNPISADSPVLGVIYYWRLPDVPQERHVWRGFASQP